MSVTYEHLWTIKLTTDGQLPWQIIIGYHGLTITPLWKIITSRLSTGNNHGQIWEILAIINHDYFQPWLQNGQFRKIYIYIMFSRQDLGRFQKRSGWCRSPSVQHSPITSGVTLGLLILVGNHVTWSITKLLWVMVIDEKNANAINP